VRFISYFYHRNVAVVVVLSYGMEAASKCNARNVCEGFVGIVG